MFNVEIITSCRVSKTNLWQFLTIHLKKKEDTAPKNWIKNVSHEDLHSLQCSPNIVTVIKCRRLRRSDHVARMEEGRSAFKILTGKSIGKRPLGIPGRRWEDNIRIYLEEIDINASNWVDSADDRDYWRALVNVILNLRIP